MTDTSSHDEQTAPRAPVLALAADLIFASRIRATATAVGASAVIVRSGEELVARARDAAPRLVLVDLEARAADPVGAISRLRAAAETAAVPIVAFASHLNREAIEAARAAGATRVLARSAFVRELPTLLADASAG